MLGLYWDNVKEMETTIIVWVRVWGGLGFRV